MKIRFLTESLKGQGLGHVARCYSLATVFLDLGYEVDFFVRGGGDFLDFLQGQKGLVTESKNGAAGRLHPVKIEWEGLSQRHLLEVDICIIDTYEISSLEVFLDHSQVVVLIDDDGRWEGLLEGRENLFLLNPNGYYRNKTLDSGLRGHVFSGLEYALVNPCFHKATRRYVERRVFVCFGGEDLGDMSARVFNALQELDSKLGLGLSIVVVLGANYKGALLGTKPKSPHEIHHNAPQPLVADLLASALVSIVSGGGIVFESILLASHTMAIKLASNQSLQIDLLKQDGLIEELSLENLDNDLEKSLLRFCSTEAYKAGATAKRASNLGTKLNELATGLILDSLNKKIGEEYQRRRQSHKDFSLEDLVAIDFCNMNGNEAMRVLRYRNNPLVRQNMYGTACISASVHFNFIQSLQTEPKSKYFLVKSIGKNETQDIGVISITKISLKHKHAYLGIYKNPELQAGSGYSLSYGTQLMGILKHIAFNKYKLHMLYLEVSARNLTAIRFYEKEGFMFLGELVDGFRFPDALEGAADAYGNVLVYGIKNPQSKPI